MKIVNSNVAMQSFSQKKVKNLYVSDMSLSLTRQELEKAPSKKALIEEKMKGKVDDKAVSLDITGSSVQSHGTVLTPVKDQNQEEKAAKALAIEIKDQEVEKSNAIDRRQRPKTKLELLRELIRALFGDDYTINTDFLDDLFAHEKEEENYSEIRLDYREPLISSSEQTRERYDVAQFKYSNVEIHYEKQSTEFQATGTVNTSDGKSINLNLNFKTHSESFDYSSSNVELKLMKRTLVDPLVINLDSSSFGLSDITIDFDLNVDGEQEQIYLPNKGMGFLALDKNENGFIDNGSELFGTKSGDGFKDLAEFDEDKNGWIDENDSVFSKLKLWMRDGKTQRLISLKDAEIGAIFLGSVSTEFSFKNQEEEKGQLRRSGFVLHENGKASTIHHIDFSI